MHDKPFVLGGLLVLLALLTFPIWYNRAAGTTSKGPQLVRPAGEKYCVAPVDYMKNYHMELLVQWRDQVVREGKRTWVAFNGASYQMNLTGTCLRCHNNKAEFCDRCHDYAAVKAYCWDCHVDPRQLRKGETYALR